MTEQEKLNADYARYLQEREKAQAEGRAIGTFIEWVHLYGSLSIKVPKRGEEGAGQD